MNINSITRSNDTRKLIPTVNTNVVDHLVGGGFDYADLPNDEERQFIQRQATLIRDLGRRTAESVMAIGKALTEVKERLLHGTWLPWLTAEFGWSDRTARHFMEVYEKFKLENFSDLQIDPSALYLLAAHKTPAPVRQELMQRAKSGERITRKAVAETATKHQLKTGTGREKKPPIPVLNRWQVKRCGSEKDFRTQVVRIIRAYERYHPRIANLNVIHNNDGVAVGVKVEAAPKPGPGHQIDVVDAKKPGPEPGPGQEIG